MRRALLAALVFAVGLTLSSVATAQEPATLLLKSGERVSGDLVDMGGSHFELRVDGQQRRVPIGDVAVIDFSGNAQNLPDSELTRANSSRNILVMRNGQMVEGKLYDVGGRHPLQITFNSASGAQQEYRSNEIGRIYLDRPTTSAGTSGNAGGQGPEGSRTFQVSASRAWTPTGITVRKGEVIRLTSSGQVRFGAGAEQSAGVTGKDGSRAVRATLPTVFVGALIGRIANGQPFGIGDQATITAPESGQLYLGVNDDEYSDNSGEFTVSVTTSGTNRAIPR